MSSNAPPCLRNRIGTLYEGAGGKLLSVATMIFGISLFLRLVQVMLRRAKVELPCPACGLGLHDHDAVHCKACGTIMNIPDDGVD